MGEVAVAEAGLLGVGGRRAVARGGEPPLELGSEAGGDALQGGERLPELDELVLDAAAGDERDAGAVKAGRHPRRRVDGSRERRSGTRPVLQQLRDPGPAGHGLQQRQLQRFDEAERSRDGERRSAPPEQPRAQLRDGRRGHRTATIGSDLAVDGDRRGLLAGRSAAMHDVPEDTAVLAAVVTAVDVAAGRGEASAPRVGERVAEDLEHGGRVRSAHQGGELAVDREQRDCHGERLQHRNRGRERRHLGPAVHATGQRGQAGLEVGVGGAGLGEEASDDERRDDPATVRVAHLDPVSHETAGPRCVHGLRALAALDAAVREERGLEAPAHAPLVEGAVQTRQLRSQRRASPEVPHGRHPRFRWLPPTVEIPPLRLSGWPGHPAYRSAYGPPSRSSSS